MSKLNHMSNVLRAIININALRDNNLRAYSTAYLNRINAAGEQLESYIKDAVASSFRSNEAIRIVKHNQIFAYLGNQNNPPDAIIKNGDAFEVKKIESPLSSLALNSSYPKDMLYAMDQRITADCKSCDSGNWLSKDIFYTVGYVKNGNLKTLFFVQGNCYAAAKPIYEKLHNALKTEVTNVISSVGLQGAKTVELGKIKKVDPLGITTLRIRGMWDIMNPARVYANICPVDLNNKFSLFALMREAKYNSFDGKDIDAIESNKSITASTEQIKDPNNPAKLLKVKVIKLIW